MPSKLLSSGNPCDKCGSSDARAKYDDGHEYCFSCNTHFPAPSEKPSEAPRQPSTAEVLSIKPRVIKDPSGASQSLSDRNITKSTCAKYNVTVDSSNKIIFPYGKSVYKVRDKSKRFYWVGSDSKDTERLPLFGSDKFLPSSAKYLLISEGELDCLSSYQMSNGVGAHVSIRDGAGSALKCCKEAYEYINSFPNIVLAFDSDRQGQDAMLQVAELLPPKKVKLMKFRDGFKDANDYLVANKQQEFIKDFWAAQTFMPDGIISGSTLKDLVLEPLEKSIAYYPFGGLNDLTGGVRSSELVTVCAGSGLGKSLFLKEIIYKLLKSTEENIGLLFLEESVKRTALSLMSLDANKPLHLSETEASEEEKNLAFEATLGTNRVYLFDSFGSTSVDNIVNRVRYMAKALSCKYVFLDHISIVVSDQQHGDERRALDEITTRLRMLVQECNITLFAVSHLKRPSGTGHEDGAATSLSQLRGSGSIAQLSDMVVGLERDSQNDDPVERHTTRVRVIKNRYSGLTGKACALYYNHKTGRMEEVIDDDLEEN
jgi:twinkle protein